MDTHHPFSLKAGWVHLDVLKDAELVDDMTDLCILCNRFFLFSCVGTLRGRNPSLFLFICDAVVRIKCNLLGQ